VGSLVAQAQREGASLRAVAARELPAHSPAVAARLAQVFDPAQAVRAKAARGGTAPEAVRRALDEAERRLRER
jgi:argininosuccinate lyase